MELIVQAQTIAKLSIQQAELKPFLAALDSKKVAQSTESEIACTLSQAVTKAFFYLNYKPKSSEEYGLIIDALLSEVVQHFKGLTLEEIKLACLHGSKGYYGDVMGIGVAQVLKWLDMFMADSRRIKARKELSIARESKQECKQLTNDDYKNLALNAFEQYKKTGHYDDYGNIIYNFLEREDIINFCSQRKKEIKNTVLELELKKRSTPFNIDEKRRFEREKNEILNGFGGLAGKCKRYALQVYFSELLEMGMELEISSPLKKAN